MRRMKRLMKKLMKFKAKLWNDRQFLGSVANKYRGKR